MGICHRAIFKKTCQTEFEQEYFPSCFPFAKPISKRLFDMKQKVKHLYFLWLGLGVHEHRFIIDSIGTDGINR